MGRYRLLILIILLETLQTVYSGSDSFKLSSPKLNKETELTKSNLSADKGYLFENNEAPSQEKIIEKRRLLFNEGEITSPAAAGREFENNEYSTRRTNYSVTETETQNPEYQKTFSNWENKQNGMFFPAGSQIHSSFRVRQPNSNQMSEQRTDIFETAQAAVRNEEKNLELIANAEFRPRTGNKYSGRFGQGIHDHHRSGELFNRRVSIPTMADHGMVIPKRYNDERVGEINHGYLGNSDMKYYNRDTKGFWKPNFYRPEKGVIINFNTECPSPRQLNNQMVHKFIFTPKSHVQSLPDISPFQIPETAFMTPTYYL